MPINIEAVSSSYPSILGCRFRGIIQTVYASVTCNTRRLCVSSRQVQNCDSYAFTELSKQDREGKVLDFTAVVVVALADPPEPRQRPTSTKMFLGSDIRFSLLGMRASRTGRIRSNFA